MRSQRQQQRRQQKQQQRQQERRQGQQSSGGYSGGYLGPPKRGSSIRSHIGNMQKQQQSAGNVLDALRRRRRRGRRA